MALNLYFKIVFPDFSQEVIASGNRMTLTYFGLKFSEKIIIMNWSKRIRDIFIGCHSNIDFLLFK